MKKLFYSLLSAVLLAAAQAIPASADVKIVSEVTMKGLPEQAKTMQPGIDKPVTTMTLYKGDKQRTEAGGTITIYDCAADKLYTLDTTKKTYTVSSVGNALNAVADNPFLAMMKFETKAFVKPGTERKTIAGKAAKSYIYTAILKMSMEGGDPSISAMMPTITMKGIQWTTDAVTLPANCAKMLQSQFARRVPPFLASGMKPLMDQMATIKGTPLSNQVTVSFIVSAAAGGLPGMPKEPIITTTEVKSVSEEPLDESLFTVPADYTLVEAAQPGTPAPPPAGAVQ